MTIIKIVRIASPIAAVAVLVAGPWSASALTPAGELAAHRAIYELKLSKARGKGGGRCRRADASSTTSPAVCAKAIPSISGKCRNSTTGKARSHSATCARTPGRTPLQRLQVQLAKLPQPETLIDSVDGQAERQPKTIKVTLTKPKDKQVDLDVAIVFPTEHVRLILDAARAGKSILEFPVYDGSESRREGLQHADRRRSRDRPRRARPDRCDKRQTGACRNEAVAGDRELFREIGEDTASNCRSIRSRSSCTRTASRARSCSTTTTSPSAANSTTLDIKDTRPCPYAPSQRRVAIVAITAILGLAILPGLGASPAAAARLSSITETMPAPLMERIEAA